jgi:[ribosomal protein S5]-alanine N-acetyltransferase
MILNSPLKTEHLVLKNLEPSDATGPYKEWVHDPEVNRYLELRHSPPNEAKLNSYISNLNSSENNLLLGIFVQDGFHIGNIKLGPININNYRGTIGLFIGDKKFWGNGFATETIIAVTDYAFGSLNLIRVDAGISSSNKGSLKAFLKAGFEIEGRLKKYRKLIDGWEDEFLLGKVRI